jgi:hypothetical protein
MVGLDLDATGELGLGVEIAESDLTLRHDEHTHPIRFTVGAQLTLVPNACLLHRDQGPG